MPVYEYQGVDAKGKKVSGKIDGDNPKVARAKLRRQSIFPTELKEQLTAEKGGKKKLFGFMGRIKITDVSIMTRQLATLIKAHVPLVEALNAISDQIENERLKLVMTDIKEQVNEGASFATALGKYPDIFSNLFINLVKAGETSGTLDNVLLKLADFTEAQVKLTSKIKGSMTYPIVMIGVGSLVIGGLFVFVIPKITAIFADMEKTLPLITRIVISISDILRTKWYLVIGSLVLFVVGFKKILKTEKGKKAFDRNILKVPLFGRLVRLVSVSRFSSTLSTLLHGGVPLLASMEIVKNVVDNSVIREAIIKAKENITEGQSLAAPLKESGEFPTVVTHMIAIGEKTGELEHMLNTIAENYDNEVNNTIGSLTQLLEPLMIVMMGAAVGIIVVAVLLPILDLNNIAG